jgi:predicted transposase/invertase (TIGR01784 family)
VKKDIVSKDILKSLAFEISKYLLNLNINEEDIEIIDKEFTRIEKRESDIIFKYKNDIIHIEIQNSNHKEMHLRMLRYYSDILFEYENTNIFQYLLYIGKDKLNMKNRIKKDKINFEYNIINAKDIDCNYLLSLNKPEAVVLAILCDFKESDKQKVVNEILIKLKNLSEDEKDFRKYFSMVELFSKNRNLEKFVEKGEEMLKYNIEEMPSYNLGLKKGINEGIQKGIQKAVHTVAIQMIKLNLDTKTISKSTNLTENEIEELKKGIK